MTDRNYTCVANAMQLPKRFIKEPSVKVGDTFTTNQGYTVIVLEYQSAKKVLIRFLDSYKHEMYVQAGHLKKGVAKNPYHKTVFNVGYMGFGEFLSKKNGEFTAEFLAWCNMMARCYNPKYQETRPTYKGCEVCREWHNFQNFAEWYTNQKYYGHGYALDKDLLIDGNKVYSPNTCVLAPAEINSLFVKCKSNKKDSPTGVSCSSKNTFMARLVVDNKNTYLGSFKSAEEAEKAYIQAKKENIKRMALKWKNSIDEKLFNTLMAKAA